MKTILSDRKLGDIYLFESMFDGDFSHRVQEQMDQIKWLNHKIKVYGRYVKEPREVAFYGNRGVQYSYSGQRLNACEWLPIFRELKDSLDLKLGTYYNSVLVNRYRDGHDYMGWHSDNEKELGKNPIISSVSFGSPRDFILRLKKDHTQKIKIHLKNGDLLVMGDLIQDLWEHSLPKRLKVTEARLNLTFRTIEQS